MARTSHKKIKRLIYTEQKEVGDKEFFLSRELNSYLQDILDIISTAYQTRKYVRIQLEWNTKEDARVAWTDSENLHINAGTYLMKDVVSRTDRFEGVLGLMLHEDGHLLFTNFDKNLEIMNGIMNRKLIMVPDKELYEPYEAYKKVRDYLLTIKNKQVLSIIVSIWKTLVNCLEDGHVDWRIGERYPGYKPHLDYICDLCYDTMPSISEIREKRNKQKQENPDEPVFLIYDFLQYLLLYSRYGYLKGEIWEIKKEEAAMKVYDMIDWIDFAKEEKNSVKRLNYQAIVFYLSFPFDYIDALLQKYGNEDDSTVSEESMGSIENALSEAQPNSAEGISSTSSNQISSAMSSGTATASSAPSGDRETESDDSAETVSEAETVNSSLEEESGSEDNGTSGMGQGEKESDSSPPAASQDFSESQEVTEEEKDSTYDKMVESVEKASSARKEREKERSKGSPNAVSDMQRVLDKIQKNKNLQARERHLESELNSFAASIKHRDIHKGVECEVRRIDVPDQQMIDGYNAVWPELKPISQKLQGRLMKEIEKQHKGCKQKNLYFGRKLETSSLIRGDGKYYSKKKLPNGKKKLAVGLLVDESGSMSSYDRITHARLTSLIVYDFCNVLGIPIAVYGHTTSGCPDVILNAYAEYDSIDTHDRYRIMSMDSSGSNRDGYALRYMAERLDSQNAEMKLLFLISDGQPAAYGYYGEPAYEDLASIKKEYAKRNIVTIAAAIGSDKETIEYIYGKDAFLDVTDLNALPENLISIIKRYL